MMQVCGSLEARRPGNTKSIDGMCPDRKTRPVHLYRATEGGDSAENIDDDICKTPQLMYRKSIDSVELKSSLCAERILA